jgi:prepilin-type N-terminal cleavage/methylation domain-containing protein
MRSHRGTRRWGFSLLEVVIVVAIIAILAAIGIPRMSRGARGASDSALTGDLATLRNAIDLYAAEHTGAFPSAADPNTQLTQYTDAAGGVAAAKDTTHIYGPYVRTIPPLPIGAKKGSTKIAAADAAGVGWIYDKTEGKVRANTSATEKDEAGKLYSEY